MAANVPDATRLLSIQSHVVSGYVGNRAATFPLQLLGWEVDVVNTVQFSNHTGYGRWGGLRFDEAHLDDLFAHLDQNGLLRYSRVLTGYVPSPQALGSIKDLLTRLRSLNPEFIYLLDPVMGDTDRGLYVNPEVLPIYKAMLPLSTVVCPNQFEAEILADQKITSISTLRTVLHTLHTTHKVSNVIITSVALPASDLVLIGASETLADGRPAMLQVGSSLDPNEGSSKKLKPWFIQFPEIQGYFTGVGDLFSALTLARFQPNDKQGVQGPSADTPNPDPSATGISNDYKSLTPLARAAEMAVASLQGVLARTQAAIDSAPAIPSIEPASSGAGNAEDSATVAEAQLRVERMRRRELRVVQSRQEIERPDVNHRARWLRLP